MIQELFQKSRSPRFRGRVFVIEDYDMRVGRFLVEGVDVWGREVQPPRGKELKLQPGQNVSVGPDGRSLVAAISGVPTREPSGRVSVARSLVVQGVNFKSGNIHFDGSVSVEGDIAAATRVPPGHKILTRAVKKGEPLRKYNQIIGFAVDDLLPGTHIHTHNCVMGDFERDYAFCADAHPTDYVPEHQRATFMGYRRGDGRSATRNYIGIVTTVNCSAATSRMIAARLDPLLAQYPNIDGVVPLTHGGGCGMAASEIGRAHV